MPRYDSFSQFARLLRSNTDDGEKFEPRLRKSASAEDRAFFSGLIRSFATEWPAEDLAEFVAKTAPHISSWRTVERLIHTHRCTAIAYRQLTQPVVASTCSLPQGTIERMRARYVASFSQIATESILLHSLLSEFTKAEIPVLVTKGLAVGSWLYDDPALREHDDIDLLVPTSRDGAAHEVLTALGYVGTLQPPLYFGEAPATANYRRDAQELHVDLSFDPLRIFWPPDTSLDPFTSWYERRQDIIIGGKIVPTLGPEDQFIHLARHLQFHDYFRANWFIDVLLLLRKFGDELDWSIISRLSSEHGLTGGLFRTLELATTVYGAEVPECAMHALRPSRFVRTIHARIWPDSLALPREHPRPGGSPITPRFLSPRGTHPIGGLILLSLDRNRRRNVRYLVQRVVPPKTWLEVMYANQSGTKPTFRKLLTIHWREQFRLRRRIRHNYRLRSQ